MKCILLGVFLFSAILLSPPAYAGKVEVVQAAVKRSCGKSIPAEEALRLVKSLFLSCVPGDKVPVDGCKVDCLKENSGAVIGQ